MGSHLNVDVFLEKLKHTVPRDLAGLAQCMVGHDPDRRIHVDDALLLCKL